MSYNSSIYSKGTTQYQDLDISFLPNPGTGDLRVKTDADAIKQSLKNLVYTRLGERPFQPNVGSTFENLLFEPLDVITANALSTSLQETIANWEPRVQVIKLDVIGYPSQNTIGIALYYNVVNISDPQQFQIILDRVR